MRFNSLEQLFDPPVQKFLLFLIPIKGNFLAGLIGNGCQNRILGLQCPGLFKKIQGVTIVASTL